MIRVVELRCSISHSNQLLVTWDLCDLDCAHGGGKDGLLIMERNGCGAGGTGNSPEFTIPAAVRLGPGAVLVPAAQQPLP